MDAVTATAITAAEELQFPLLGHTDNRIQTAAATVPFVEE